MNRAAAIALLACAALGCGGELPARYVIERDLGDYRYRRYQRTLGAELEVAGNPAHGHTATYLRRGGERVAVATAFVTVHERAASLAAETRERLHELQRYRFGVRSIGGQHVWLLDGGPDERWAVWVSGRHVVKLGAPRGGAFPEAIVDAYAAAYPSDLDEHGRPRPDASSRGPSAAERARREQADRELPRHLRQNAPR
jgi:hypothetical protein